ncbi:low molecular weight phosphatase family protein [Candidatus Woesearchaeota archaeon]|nr:low molecular weight phosphatase family protein [Candidatus Woesearchaeota archaeon]
MNILFICRYNKFRSKIAEAFFNKHYKGTKHKAKSAGIIRGSPVDDEIRACAKRNGVKVSGGSYGIDVPILRWHDMMVIVAEGIPKELFAKDERRFGRKLRHWKIPDIHGHDDAGRDRTAKEIEKKVKRLISEI